MITAITISTVLICLAFYVGVRWQRKQTLHDVCELVQDHQRMAALTDRTADILARIDDEIVMLAEEEILAEEGAELLDTLDEEESE